MRSHLFLSAAILSTAAAPAVAQTRTTTVPNTIKIVHADQARGAIGVTISGSASARDTLGLLVVSVTPGGPADKAGIEEGTRIAAINGVSLRLDAADVGDPMVGELISRRLTRELGKVTAGAEVDLRLYAAGQSRNVKVAVADAPVARRIVGGAGALMVEPAEFKRIIDLTGHVETRFSRGFFGDRPALGVTLGANGSKRDSLGVFVVAVDEGGPAAKAGVEEGQRIAAINGIDLRVSREEAGDADLAAARVRRLQRVLDSVKVGDQVELRVVGNGQTRTVRVTTVRGADLPRGDGTMMLLRKGPGVVITRPPR